MTSKYTTWLWLKEIWDLNKNGYVCGYELRGDSCVS